MRRARPALFFNSRKPLESTPPGPRASSVIYSPPVDQDRKSLFPVRASWVLVVVMMIGLPLVYSPLGREAFRVPKLALFHALGFLVAGLLGAGLAMGDIDLAALRRNRAPALLAAAIVAWTAFTALFSVAPRVSWESFATVVCAAAVFAATLLAAPRRPLADAALLTIGAVASSVMVFLQAAVGWTPIRTAETGRMAIFGLFGNPNDVVMYLVAPTLACTAVGIVARGALRWYGVLAAAMMGAALLLTASVTGIASAATGGVVMAAVALRGQRSRRRALAIALAALLLLGAFLGSSRIGSMIESFGEGGLDLLLTGRLLAFASAIEMIRDHPLVGVGPGMFAWHYFDYAPLADARWGPFPFAAPIRVLFSEAHNDHLQIAAETGLPGLLLFWAALAMVGALALRRTSSSPRSAFSELCGPSVAASLFVMTLAQFPLQLAASAATLVVISGLCFAWSSADSEPS